MVEGNHRVTVLRWSAVALAFALTLAAIADRNAAYGWFHAALFHYSPTDDLVHWSLGAFLVLLGSLGRCGVAPRTGG